MIRYDRFLYWTYLKFIFWSFTHESLSDALLSINAESELKGKLQY